MATATSGTALTWTLDADLRQLFEFPFMVNAYRAGTLIAVTASLVGWFVVLRRQTFVAHTLAVIGFPGAAGAVLVGLSAQLGIFGFCLGGAAIVAFVPRSRAGTFTREAAAVGTLQAFALACGYLFVSLFRGNLSGINALLFGSFLAVTTGQVAVLAVVAGVTVIALGVMARPLLFASVDPDVALARGVPVAGLSTLFLALLGVTAAASSQITGSLLVFALLVLPAATAQSLTANPARSAALAVGIALVVTWAGLAVAYFSPFPIGFWITSLAFGTYIVARLSGRVTSATAHV